MSEDPPTAEALCYGDERVVERSPLGDGWVALTTHRLLAYDPDGDGRRFEAVDRPNVRGVDVDTAGDPRFRRWGLRAAAYGVAAGGGGLALRATDLAATLSVGVDAGTAPLGGLLAVTQALASALATLVSLLLVAGVLLLLAGLGLVGQYVRTRHPALVVERFGDDPVRLSVPESDGRRAASALSTALSTRDQ